MAKRVVTLDPNFEALVRQTEKSVRDALERAFRDIKATADKDALAQAIENKNVSEVIRILNISPRYFSDVDRALDQAYYEGATRDGRLVQREVGSAFVVRFDGRHARAEQWTRTNGSRLIVEVNNDAREAVRVVIESQLQAGRNPRRIVEDIIGRNIGGVRQGGIVGLHSRFAGYVANARNELANADSNYFTRKQRDRRLDSQIQEFIAAGKPIPVALQDKAITRYSDNLLKLRGETIARTESLRALNAGRYEMAMQLVESGQVPQGAITFIWDATISKRTRDSHLALNGEEVGFDQPFQSPLTGALMRYPGDSSLGAPGSETINCRCTVRTRIDRRQLATKRPVGRPRKAVTPPPVSPPVPTPPRAPVPPPVAPAPLQEFPLPRYRDPESFTDFFEWRDYARNAGIARSIDFPVMLRAERVQQLGHMTVAAQKIHDRFALPALDELRRPDTSPDEQKRKQKAGGWMNLGGMGPPWYQPPYIVINESMLDPDVIPDSRKRNQESSNDFTPFWRNELNKQAERLKGTRLGPLAQQLADIMATSTWEHSAMRSKPDYIPAVAITVHEYGHYFHGVYRAEVDKAITEFDWEMWALVISEYSRLNAKEVVAEAFTIYVLGDENDYRRIPPPLLRLFRQKDRQYGTNA